MSQNTNRQPCPVCGRPVRINVYGRIPQHTDLRTGGRSICPASGKMPEHTTRDSW